MQLVKYEFLFILTSLAFVGKVENAWSSFSSRILISIFDMDCISVLCA